MHKPALLFISITLIFLFLQTVHAHLPVPMSTTLQVYKNTTTTWTMPELKVEGGGNFQYINAFGKCLKYSNKGSGFQLDFYYLGQLVKTVYGEGTAKSRSNHPISFSNDKQSFTPTPPPFSLENILADNMIYNPSGGCPGNYFNGELQIHQKKGTTDLIEEIKINSQATQIGTLKELLPNVKFTVAPPDQLPPGIIAENIFINESRKDVLAWFGEGKEASNPSKGSTSTTTPDKSIIYACSDINQNGICDADDAATAGCDVFGTEDWYKETCCTASLLKTAGCKYVETVNAYCGQDSEGKPEFANAHEIGEIHDFLSCTKPLQIVFDEKGKKHECTSTAGWDFIAIKEHEYYCDKTQQQIFECGANESYSQTNTLSTGKNITINKKTNYCVEKPVIFSTNLDFTTNNSCLFTGEKEEDGTHTGQIWTGSRCCSEEDDLVEGNEYYSEDYAKNSPIGTINYGGCWNSKYIKSGTFVPDKTDLKKEDKSIINYNGTFYGCQVTDQQLIAMDDTNYHPDKRVPVVKITQ